MLDTNALIWLLDSSDGAKFGKQSLENINKADAVYASSVSVLEVRIKSMLGKLEAPQSLTRDIDLAGIKSLSFNMNHADAVQSLPDLKQHDPFDRMLLAQAQVESMLFLTSDKFITEQGIDFVLSARN